jgi:hypothetical protein
MIKVILFAAAAGLAGAPASFLATPVCPAPLYSDGAETRGHDGAPLHFHIDYRAVLSGVPRLQRDLTVTFADGRARLVSHRIIAGERMPEAPAEAGHPRRDNRQSGPCNAGNAFDWRWQINRDLDRVQARISAFRG